MIKFTEFNINQTVQVKLTDTGKEELKRQHEELKQQFEGLYEYSPKKEDGNGFSLWQMHILMHTFGHMVRMGGPLPFDPEIKIELEATNAELVRLLGLAWEGIVEAGYEGHSFDLQDEIEKYID